MKENIFRMIRPYVFLILGACISFIGCNSDDEDEIVIVGKSFLEKYDGTKWETVEPFQGYNYYLRVNNNSIIPFEIWKRSVNSQEETCYSHENDFMVENEHDGAMIITENSGNRFTIANEAQEFWWTIEIRGDILKFDGQAVWDNEILPIWDSPGSRVLKKTNVNVDALEICNEDY